MVAGLFGHGKAHAVGKGPCHGLSLSEAQARECLRATEQAMAEETGSHSTEATTSMGRFPECRGTVAFVLLTTYGTITRDGASGGPKRPEILPAQANGLGVNAPSQNSCS